MSIYKYTHIWLVFICIYTTHILKFYTTDSIYECWSQNDKFSTSNWFKKIWGQLNFFTFWVSLIMFWFGWNTGFLLDHLKSLFSSYSDVALKLLGGWQEWDETEGSRKLAKSTSVTYFWFMIIMLLPPRREHIFETS